MMRARGGEYEDSESDSDEESMTMQRGGERG